MSNAEYFIALGGNTGQVLTHFQHALVALKQADIAILALSKLYHSKAQGGSVQDDYLNAVVKVESSLGAEPLLQFLLQVEQQLGRVRLEHWGPRTLDLDLLACGQQIQQSDFLTLPHPRMHQRHFVMLPLCDISADWVHPVYHQTALALLAQLSTEDITEHRQQWSDATYSLCQT